MNIIFDLDGTMWDSTKQVELAWNKVLKRYNPNLKFDSLFFKNIMGSSNEDIETIFEKEYFIKDKDFLKQCQKEELVILKQRGAILYPHVAETIKELSINNNLFIASNCQLGYIDCFLDYYNLRKYFRDYIYSDNIYKNKTESLRVLITNNNIKDFYYVGDTYGDFVACSNHGGKFIFASYGFGFVECENTINDFSELLKIFNKNL